MVRADLINRFTFIYYKRFNELCTIDGRIPLNLTSCEVKVYDTYRGGEMVEKIPDNFIHILFNSDKLYKIPENILPKRVETLELNNILLEMYPKNINSLSINIKKPINIYDDNINITINLDSDIRINNLYTKIDILGRHKIKLPKNKIEMLKLSKSNLSKIYNFPEYVRELDISNNKLKKITVGILVDTRAYNNTISFNQFENISVAAIAVQDKSFNIVIDSNIISECKAVGILIGEFGNVHNNRISNNMIKDTLGAGIEIRISSQNKLINNHISNGEGGINLDSSDDNLVSNNLIWNSRFGINLSNSSNTKVMNNSLYGSAYLTHAPWRFRSVFTPFLPYRDGMVL